MVKVLGRPRLLSALLIIYRWFSRWIPRSLRPPFLAPAKANEKTAIAITQTTVGTATPTAAIHLFIGCIADSYEKPLRQAFQQLAARAGLQCQTVTAQTCCGAAAEHLGDSAEVMRLTQKNRQAFAGAQRIVSFASGCHSALQRQFDGQLVEDAIVVLGEYADALAFQHTEQTVALHIPCTQRQIDGAIVTLRKLLAKVPGLKVIDLPDTGCCGGAGLHMLSEPERAAALRAPLLQAIDKTPVDAVLSANIGCRLHLSTVSNIEIVHPLEFLARALR